METLPDLVITRILNYLCLRERARFRLVCKKFSEFNLRGQERLCINQVSYPLNTTWTLTGDSERGKLVGYHNSSDFLNRKFHKLSCNPLMSIKKLYIVSADYLSALQISPNKLNYFRALEVLEIFEGKFEKNIDWSFKKLKVLSLNECKFDFAVELDCPLLESFVCWTTEIKNLKFSHPSSLKYLELFQFDSSIRRFKNVESLAFLCFSTIDRNICTRELSKLRELHLNCGNYKLLDFEQLNNLIGDLESEHLKVNVTWFKLTNCTQSRRVVIDESNAATALSNYPNLETNLRYRFDINFSALIKTFNSCIPDDFFEKFTSISHVEINEQTDETQFMRFLVNCKQLRCLYVNELYIKEFPYKKLAQLPTLEELEIFKSELSISDHQFLSKLKNLLSLKVTFSCRFIEFPLLFDFIWNSILRCNSLRDLYVLKNNRFVEKFLWIKIVQEQDYSFLVYSNAQILYRFESLDKLLVHLIEMELPAFLSNS